MSCVRTALGCDIGCRVHHNQGIKGGLQAMPTQKSQARVWLRTVAAVSVLVMLADVLVRKVLPHHPQAGLDHYINVVVDQLVLEWISLIAWPVIPVAGLALWVAPFLKQRGQQTRALARASFLLFVLGWLMDAAGRMVLTEPVIGNGLGLAGAGLQMAAAMLYLAGVWRAVSRPLVPSVVDILLQFGTLWLLGATGMHFAYSLGVTLDYRGHEYLRAFVALHGCLALGFIGNTGIWLMHSLLPRFFGLAELRGRSMRSMLSYNIVLAAWGLGLAWCVQFPLTWVRLPLALVSIALPAATVYLLVDLGLIGLLGTPTQTSRRSLGRVTGAVAMAGMVLGAALAGGLGFWLGASSEVIVPSTAGALRDILRLGFGSNLAVMLLVCLLGARAVGGLKTALIAAPLVVNIGALLLILGIQLASPLTNMDLTGPIAYAEWLTGVAHGLWAFWVLLTAPWS